MGVITHVSSQSLSHFLFYLIIILLLVLHDRTKEITKLREISSNQDAVLLQCKEAISAQRNYITLLESEYIRHGKDSSPIH